MIPACISDTVYPCAGVIIRRNDAKSQGRMDQEFVRVLKAFYPTHDPDEWTCTEYNEWDQEKDLETKKCLCGKAITLICTIQHVDGNVFQVGCECVKKHSKKCYVEMLVLKREFRSKKKKEAELREAMAELKEKRRQEAEQKYARLRKAVVAELKEKIRKEVERKEKIRKEAERNKCAKCRKDISAARTKYPNATHCYPCAPRCACGKIRSEKYLRCYTCARAKRDQQ